MNMILNRLGIYCLKSCVERRGAIVNFQNDNKLFANANT